MAMQLSVCLLWEAFLDHFKILHKDKTEIVAAVSSVWVLFFFFHVQIQRGTSSVLEPASWTEQDRSFADRLLKENKRKCMEKRSICSITYGEMKCTTYSCVQIILKWDGCWRISALVWGIQHKKLNCFMHLIFQLASLQKWNQTKRII